MRILIANDGLSDVGGVQTYLAAVMATLEKRGHALALAYCTDDGDAGASAGSRRFPRFQMSGDASCQGRLQASQWAPDLCYSHNMSNLAVERSLLSLAPTIKFMHGYFGTCVSGLKMHAFPCVTACERPYGTGCLAYYLPRRCGCLSPGTLLTGWRWSEAQRSLFERYAAILVASEHMRREYVRSGVPIERVSVNPLFAGRPAEASAAPVPPSHRVAFLGRMTPAKGGDLLIRAVRYASQRLNLPIHLTMIGDGPERTNWTALATRLGVETLFTGWVAGDERWPFIRDASLIAVPSLWPEPFGMAGLEAGAVGVAAIALDSGGISEWLRDGVNGMLVRTPSAEAFGSALASLLADRPRLASLRDGALRIAREMSLARHVDRLEALCQTVHGADRRAVPVPCGSC